MTGHKCCICGNTTSKDPSVPFHRFTKEPGKRALWLRVFQLREENISPNSRVCARHFPEGNVKKTPSITLGKRFASPIKQGPRAKRAKERSVDKQLCESRAQTPLSSSSRSVTPASTSTTSPEPDHEVLTTVVGDQYDSDYEVHELPSVEEPAHHQPTCSSTEVIVNTALLARIEALEAENQHLKRKQKGKSVSYFKIEDICHDDKLVQFYTGLLSYTVFLAFFEFLGPVVEHLNYWGSKEGHRRRSRSKKLDPKNQLFLTLVKLKLNLKLRDLALRFGLSTSLTSRYLTTWICFLYQHLKEIDWMPTVEQVLGTLPDSFRKKYPTTFAIIDGSEVFIETPSDLHMQSSTWSQYKHHNTVKFLVACTPNGAICYISQVYVGSISDVELTRICGLLTKLKDKPGISIMADRGFTIKDLLKEINIGLNIPPFLDGKKQLSPAEIEKGRKIASLRIHVERAIGRIKLFSILKGTIPLSMARITNQIVFVCAFLTNFQPALVPLPDDDELTDADVEKYFEQLSDCNSDSDEDEADQDHD